MVGPPELGKSPPPGAKLALNSSYSGLLDGAVAAAF